ncbi:hypothetical protein B0T16DRAFT_462717 [Cercophora newfieldiana]|uniref:Fungal N-terminal domain-containing protein n=1 Tax=Cercophora newfieldiana TaxID=92897 RepID=A0AA40CJ23_9PEZI|nr:hypothetical protein B0T16DRAFT_462717 [Cercophora newfieldiana]
MRRAEAGLTPVPVLGPSPDDTWSPSLAPWDSFPPPSSATRTLRPLIVIDSILTLTRHQKISIAMAEPLAIVSAITGALHTITRTALHVTDLVQTPSEVSAATSDLHACQKKLADLLALRKQHEALLATRPADAAAIDATITTTWTDLQRAKPILERNKITSSGQSFGRRLRWKMADRSQYQILEKAILRNHVDVRDQIGRLESIVRLSPLEKFAVREEEEKRRRQEEVERERDTRDIKGLVLMGEDVGITS